MRRLLKIVHNPTIAIIFGVLFALVIHLAFAFGVYGAGLVISDNVLQSLANASISARVAPISALLYSILLFGGSVWAFIYKNHTRKDVDAYGTANHEDGWFTTRHKLEALLLLIGGLEISSLMFRLSLMPPSAGRTWLGVFGLILWVVAYILGDIIHATIHRPVAVDILHSHNTVERSLTDDAMRLLPKATAEQRQRWLGGDTGVIDEIADDLNARERTRHSQKITRYEGKQERQRQKREDFDNAQSMADRLFRRKHPPVPFTDALTTDQAERQSQNGHRSTTLN